MKNYLLKKRITWYLGVLLAMIAASVYLSSTSVVSAQSNQDFCVGDQTSWTPLSNSGGVLSSGSYYLGSNLQLLQNITISSGTVNINLDGNILWGAIGSNSSIFTVTGGTLNIYDCNTDNKVHSYKIKEIKSNSTQDIYYNDPNHSNKFFQRYYDFNDIGDGVIVGGIITGGHKFSTSANLKSTFNYAGGGSAFLIGGSSGTVNFYGGTISGNSTTALSQWGSKRERSGTVGIRDGGSFNFYDGQIVGNSSRYAGAGIYLFGSSSLPARVNIYGGIIRDNYSLETAYNFQNTSSMFIGGAGLSTDNVGNEASIISISGSPKIVDNMHYDFANNKYISTNMSYSTESVNSIKILDKLYTQNNGTKTYASIGLWGGAGSQLTSNYTVNGNTHEDVNKIFFADDKTKAVAYNTLNGEIQYVTADLKTLTYNANNGTTDTSSISVVDKITVSGSIFTKTGHLFLHWNTSPDDSGTRYSPDDVITLVSNQSLYAIWAKATYRIQYWANGGTIQGIIPNDYTYGDTVVLPTPSWSGKTFDGWYDNAMLVGSAVTQIDSLSFGDKVYYAKWLGVNEYTITSTAATNGTITPSGSIIYDGISQHYSIAPMNGYKIATFTVDGFDRKNDIINNVYEVTGITSNTDIHVTFEKILSTDITVYSTSGDFGTISPKGYSVVSSGSSLTYTITPNPGYRVSNVTVNGISVGAVSSYTLQSITSSQSIHAEFSIMTSPIKFNVNNGSFALGYVAPSVYFEGTGLSLPSLLEVIKTNYSFLGWFDNVDLEGTAITSIDSSQTGAKEYWAKWSINQYTITFDTNGGSSVSAITQDYDTNVLSPLSPTRTGYTFGGWYANSELTTVYVFSTIPAGNITVYAKWSINQYTITFDSNSGSIVSAITQNYNTDVSTPQNPIKTGYTFGGWYANSELTSAYVFNTMPSENITVYAKWSINQYTITFNSNGGSLVSVITQDYDTSVLTPTSPTRTGYTFEGWYANSELTTAYVFNTMPSENITVFAKWSINQYTISFNSNGGSIVSAITQDYNTAISSPLNPTKIGHTFDGWHSDTDLATLYSFSAMPAESMTVYAKWSINQYTITFDSNGGSIVSVITLNYDTSVLTPTSPTKTGYTFGGWYANSDFTTSYTFNTMPAESITVYAKWSIISYTITFDSNGGSLVSAITQDYNTAVSSPLNPAKTGYTFGGWYSDTELVTLFSFSTMPAESMTVYAKWSIDQYTITFDSNGGSSVSAITQDYHTTVLTPSSPTRTGYTFGGWYANSELTSAYVFNTMPAESIIVYAKWNTVEYTILYHMNGGSNHLGNPLGYHIETLTVPLQIPTKTGYLFVGWYDSSDFSGDEVTSISLGSNGDKEYWAKWSINQYTITFDSSSGSLVSAITQDYNTAVSAPQNPTRTGFAFSGWYSNSNLTTSYTFNTMPAENTTVYAKWIINSYTIMFDSNGGSFVDAIIQDYNTAVSAPQNPTRTGYSFGGWYSDTDVVTLYSFSTMPAESLTVYAKWNIIPYTITFDSKGGSIVSAITQDYDTNVLTPTSPTRTGYTFGGWYANSELTTVYVFSTMPSENITVFAKWSINQYTITFDSNGGSLVSAITQNYNTDVSTPQNPAKTGYTFGGWYANSELTTAYVFNTMTAGSITIYAKWSINQYTITFNSNGGSIVSAITQDYNTAVSAPQNPTKTGYTFGGWYANSELTTAYVFNTMSAGSITIYAKWSINQYTITFDSNGGSIVSVITQDYNTTILTPLSPTKTGYTFGGWYANSELTTAYVFSTMPSENITVFAKWSINQYTITFDSNGGSIVSAITQEYGSPIVAPSNPTKEGYTFNGWSQTIPSVVLPEHMTIFAYWLKVSEPYNGEIQSKTEGIIEAINPFLLENKNAEVIIRFERMQKNEVDQLTISLIESHVDKKQGFSVIDISVIIKTEGSADVKVNELTQKTIITITIPQSDRGYKNYQVVRIHNGQLEALETVYDEQNQTLRFETDRFSNYAIIYETASTNWAWWLLSSLIPIGFVCYHYRNVITVFISKKIKQIHISK